MADVNSNARRSGADAAAQAINEIVALADGFNHPGASGRQMYGDFASLGRVLAEHAVKGDQEYRDGFLGGLAEFIASEMSIGPIQNIRGWRPFSALTQTEQADLLGDHAP